MRKIKILSKYLYEFISVILIKNSQLLKAYPYTEDIRLLK